MLALHYCMCILTEHMLGQPNVLDMRLSVSDFAHAQQQIVAVFLDPLPLPTWRVPCNSGQGAKGESP